MTYSSPDPTDLRMGIINFILSSPGTTSIDTPPLVSLPSLSDCGRFCQRIYPGGPAFARTIMVPIPKATAAKTTATMAFVFRFGVERANQIPAEEIARNMKTPAKIVRLELCIIRCDRVSLPLLRAAASSRSFRVAWEITSLASEALESEEIVKPLYRRALGVGFGRAMSPKAKMALARTATIAAVAKKVRFIGFSFS